MLRKLLLGAIPTLVAGIAVMTLTAQERGGVSLELVKPTLVKVSKPGSSAAHKSSSPKFHSAHSSQQPKSQQNLSGDHELRAWGYHGYRSYRGYSGHYRGWRSWRGYRSYYGYGGYHGAAEENVE